MGEESFLGRIPYGPHGLQNGGDRNGPKRWFRSFPKDSLKPRRLDSSIAGSLREGLLELGLDPSQNQLEQFQVYYEELMKWNRMASLISQRDEKRFVTHHLLPSLSILQFIPSHLSELADVGSGAGLPGIPLKIMRPSLKLTLIESKLKKALFLKEIVDKLSLSKTVVINKRAEEVGFRYPLVVTRALGKLKETVKICLPLLASGGELVIIKGSKEDKEFHIAQPWIDKLGGQLARVREIVFPVTHKRGILVLISKVSRET